MKRAAKTAVFLACLFAVCSVSVGEERDTIEEVHEPFLLREGLLKRTPKGRVATSEGYRHLGLTGPGAGAPDDQHRLL